VLVIILCYDIGKVLLQESEIRAFQNIVFVKLIAFHKHFDAVCVAVKVPAFPRMPGDYVRSVEVILDSYSEHKITCQRWLSERRGGLSVSERKKSSLEKRPKGQRSQAGTGKRARRIHENREVAFAIVASYMPPFKYRLVRK
jgi:hypothetical protein